MKVAFRASFHRDLKKIKDKETLQKVKEHILMAEEATSLAELAQIKKISGSSGYYRIRVHEYRMGVLISGDEMEFVRCLHRREVYRFFP
ncbi:type II toxin-antitoxin system RelE/ParE family toxin [Desulfonatronospira sp.]|uniref:type II toxin-antitoxin system RelE family toxin n=1 Tax=Desulfonatronospira sp. TaxID=1962951 RepID=UPI00341D9742